jgi:integrase
VEGLDREGASSVRWRPETLLKCHVQPAAKRLGITKRIGWHSFRRTFATLLGGSEDVKTMQELMRHANSKLTLDPYAQALTPAKRAAHRRLVGLIEGRGKASWSHVVSRIRNQCR